MSNWVVGGGIAAKISGRHVEIVFARYEFCFFGASTQAIVVLMAQRYFLMLPRWRYNVKTTIGNGEGGQLLITNG